MIVNRWRYKSSNFWLITQIILGELKFSSRMHYQNLESRKKILFSENKVNMIHREMDWLPICGNVFNKSLIQESISDYVSNY